MQRYRVNYRLLYGLAAGFVCLSVAAYGLWRFQVWRKATYLVDRAKQAEAAGDFEGMLGNLVQYLRLKKDDYVQWAFLGRKAAETLENRDAELRLRGEAYRVLIQAVQTLTNVEAPGAESTPEERYAHADLLSSRFALRQTLADFHLTNNNPGQALANVEPLRMDAANLEKLLGDAEVKAYIAANLSNPEGDERKTHEISAIPPSKLSQINVTEAKALFGLAAGGTAEKAVARVSEMIGYNLKEERFESEKATSRNEPMLYGLLARYWLSRELYPQRVDQVVEEMTKANPNSVVAFAEQSRLLEFMERPEQSRAALARAAELDADDADVIMLQGLQALKEYQKLDSAATVDETDATDKLLAESLALLRGEIEKQSDNGVTGPLREAFASGGDVTKAVQALAKSNEFQGALKPALATLVAYYDAAASGEEKLARTKISEALKRLRAHTKLSEGMAIFRRGLEKHPDNPIFYERTARTQLGSGDTSAALKTIDAALAKYGTKFGANPFTMALINLKADALFMEGDLEGVRSFIESLRNREAEFDLIAQFYEARIAFANNDWPTALRGLQAVRRQLPSPEMEASAAAFEGFCNENMGRYDVAIDCYRSAIRINPEHQLARYSLSRALDRAGTPSSSEESDSFERMVEREFRKPANEQNWEAIESAIDRFVAERNLPETRSLLYRAQIRVQRALRDADKARKSALFTDAREKILRAHRIDPNDKAVLLAAIRLLSLEPGSGPERALELFHKSKAKLGDTPDVRVLLADLLLAARSEQLPAQLAAIPQGMESWTKAEQALVWSTVASRLHQIGMLTEAREHLQHALELTPDSLPTAMFLFELGMQQQDEAAMSDAQDHVLRIVKDKSDPDYTLTEVKRRLYGMSNGTVSKEAAIEGRAMVDAAIVKRPTWSELYVLRGQLAVLLDGDAETALENFRKAREQARPNLNAIVLEVQLMAELGMFADALKILEIVSPEQRPMLLKRIGPEVLLRNGRAQEALELAEQVAATEPNDPNMQAWLGDVAMRSNAAAKAEASLRKALKLAPFDPNLWSRLVGFYMGQQDEKKIVQTLREAHLSLDEEHLPPLTGKYFELFGRWASARDIYEAFYGARSNEPEVARRMAEFYMNWGSRDEANGRPASRHLNHILRAVDEGRLSADAPDAVWARQQAARIFSASGSYRDSVKAEQLLSTGAGAPSDRRRDKEMLTTLLAKRMDPQSQERAVALLRELRTEKGLLSTEQGAELGQLLFRVGTWDECRREMETSISQHPDDVNLRSAYVAMMLEKKELREADVWIDKLAGLEQGRMIAQEYRVRLAAREGKKADVSRLLKGMIPARLRPDNQGEVDQMRAVAFLAEHVENFEVAVDAMRQCIKAGAPNKLEATRIVALYGPLQEGIDLLMEVFPSDMSGTLQAAIEVFRKRRQESPQTFDPAIDQMIGQALRDDPESAVFLQIQAEIYEVQGKFGEAVAAYERLLSRDDVADGIRAVALNNLAYVLALTGRDDRLGDALDATNKAAELLGPLSDILDTRAVVHLAMKNYDKAVEDMRLAIKMTPTPSKHFHLVRALVMSGQEKEAVEAWKIAVDEGLDAKNVSPLEQEIYRTVADKIQEIISRNAT